jgi:hypothetical protein
MEMKALDLLSSYSLIMEQLVAYGSAPLIGSQIGIHAAKGDYSG